MTKSLDTSILVRLCVGDVPKQVAAANHLLATNPKLAVADAAIIEAEHVLQSWYRYDRDRITKTLQMLLSQPNLNCNRTLFGEALAHYQKHPALSLVDCCLAIYAKLGNAAPLLTFDRKLANQLQHAELLAA